MLSMAAVEETITLTDLIDSGTLQRIQDAFANATGMAALTVDLDGPVTRLSNPTEFCMTLTRGCPKGAERCNRCDLQGGEEAGRTGRPAVYYCHGGLMDFAAPILLGRRQIGSMIGGQVLPEPPDEGKFRRIAREIGVDENAYIRALSKIRIVPKKTIEASAQLLYTMANELSQMGYQKYMTRQATGALLELSREMRQKVGGATRSIDEISRSNRELVRSMEGLSDSTQRSRQEVEKTDKIVSYISNVSMQTKLLGFNASVEASRAREYGAGFNVIAQEIRKLADQSQTQSMEIDKIIGTVKSMVSDIDGKIQSTNEVVAGNTSLLEGIASMIKDIDAFAARLEDMSKHL